ncbi:MAG: MFS transporter [Leuconostoc fallax]
MKTKQWAIGILILSNFLICLGISMVIPVIPYIKNLLHLTATDMGIMNALYAFAQFLASPLVGRISDRVGRKQIIIFGLLLYAISEVIFALGNTLAMLNISRIVGGISAAMVIPTSMALASDLTTMKQRAKVIGWLSAAFSGGLILGPGIGGVLARIDYKLPFWGAAVLGLISAIVALTALSNAPISEDEAQAQNQGPQLGSWAVMKSFPTSLLLLFFMILVSSFGLAGFEGVYSIYVNSVHHFDLDDIAIVLVLNGIISLIAQVVFFEPLVNRFKESRIIQFCFFFGFIGVVLIVFVHAKWSVIVATLIVFTAFDLLRPAITTLITKMAGRQQGLVSGINMSLTSVGNVVGPIMSGMLLDVNQHYAYLVVAVILLISFFIAFSIRDRRIFAH